MPVDRFAHLILIADARLTWVQLGRLAVLRAYRGMGFAQTLCEAVHEHVRALEGKELWCESQVGGEALDLG